MNTFDCMRARRSVRAFDKTELCRETVQKIADAALCAPVGMKLYDSLHLSVLFGHTAVDKFTALARENSGDAAADPVHGAAALVVVSGKRPQAVVEYANCACMIENMLLAATDLHVGSLYVHGAINAMIGTKEGEALKKLLRLPEGFTPIGSVALGNCEADFSPREIPNRVTGVDYIE